MTKFGPNAHLASARDQLGAVLRKSHQRRARWFLEDGTDLVGQSKTARSTWWPISDKVPAATKTKIEEIKKGLKDGSFTIWKGSIKDQAGKEVLKADEESGRQAIARDQLLREGRGGQAAERQVRPPSSILRTCERRRARSGLRKVRRYGTRDSGGLLDVQGKRARFEHTMWLFDFA